MISLRDVGVEESGARSQNRGGVGIEHAADFFGNGGELGGVSVSQILRQDQIVTALFQRSFGNIQEARFVCLAAPAKSFSDVGWNGDCRASQLQRQTVSFLPGEPRRERIHGQDELMRFTPYQ